MLKYYWARGRETILLPHNLHAQVGRLERDVPLRSLQMGSHRQGVYNSPAGISYTAEKRTNNKKTKVMTTNKEKIESLKKAMNVLNELYYFTNDNETMLKGKIAQAYDTMKYMKSLITKKEQETNRIQARIKFRMPNGKDKYVKKTFNDKKHMRAYIDKVCKQEDCDLDEVWY
mgnify:FL=1